MAKIWFFSIPSRLLGSCTIENLDTYVTRYFSVKPSAIDNFQRLKPASSLTINVNMEMPQLYYNMMQYKDEVTNQTWYFIVEKFEYVAPSTTKVHLRMDYLNTYPNWANLLTDRTLTKREHRDRFRKDDNDYGETDADHFIKLVDWRNEGATPTLYKRRSFKLNPLGEVKNWYLVYRSSEAVGAGTISVVDCYLVGSKPLSTGESVMIKEYALTSTSTGRNVMGDVQYFFKSDNPTIKIYVKGTSPSNEKVDVTHEWKSQDAYAFYLRAIRGGATGSLIAYEFGIVTQGDDGVASYSVLDNINPSLNHAIILKSGNGYRYGNDALFQANGISSGDITSLAFVTLNVGQYAPKSNDFSSINTTDGKLLKIIKLPYAPVQYSATSVPSVTGGFRFDSQSRFFKYVKSGTPFEGNVVETSTASQATDTYDFGLLLPKVRSNNVARHITDPKLMHSSLMEVKWTYDSFSWVLKAENIKAYTRYPQVDIKFNVSSAISSKFMFTFNPKKSGYELIDEEDYANILVVNRNNEVPIYSNSYVDYLRTGYNYDVKAKDLNNANRLWAMANNTAGAVAGVVAGGTGMTALAGSFSRSGLRAAESIRDFVMQYELAENQMEKRLTSLQYQSSSVAGADDLDLLEKYGGDILTRYVYVAKQEVLDSWDNIFYYYGYATNETKKPNVTGRLWFNYIECTPDWTMAAHQTIPRDALDTIGSSVKNGVTIFHNPAVDGNFPSWDLEQTKENYEEILLNG